MLQNSLLLKFFQARPFILLICIAVLCLLASSAHAATASQHELSAATAVNDCTGSASISGSVVDSNGEPAPNLVVIITRSPDTDHFGIEASCDYTISDEQGTFVLERIGAGEFFIQVISTEQGEGPEQNYAPPARSATLVDGEATVLEEPIQLDLAQGFVQVVLSGDDSPVTGSVTIVRLEAEAEECPPGVYDTLNGDGRIIEADGLAYWGSKYPGTYCMMATVFPESISGQHPTNIAFAHSAPLMFEIAADAQMVDLGTIELARPSKRIIGTLSTAAETGIPEVVINAQNRDTYEYLEATSDAAGYFEFIVNGGVWDVEMEIDHSVGILEQSTYTVSFDTDETETITLPIAPVKTIDSAFTGRLLDVNGELLEEWDAVSVRLNNVEDSSAEYVDIDESGQFDLPIWAGTYNLRVEVDPFIDTQLFPPIPFTVTVEAGETVDLGDILMGTPQATGSLVGPDGSEPIEADYDLFGPYNADAMKCAIGATDPDAGESYTFGEIQRGDLLQIGGLLPGSYCLYLNFYALVDGSLPLFTTTFSLADENAVVDLGTIQAPALPESPKRIVGSVTLPEGIAVQGIRVNAVKIEDGVETSPFFMEGIAAAVTDADGAYLLNLDPGEWRVSVTLNETPLDIVDTGPRLFSQDPVKTVTFEDDESEEIQTLDFAVVQQNATISGMLLKPDGTPALNLVASVHAKSEQFDSAWVSAVVDPETAQFEIDVAAGDWQVGYYIIDDYAIDDSGNDDGYAGNYVDSVIPLSVTVEENADTQQDFTLLKYDATLRGTLLNPDGSPVESSQVSITWLDQADQAQARYADVYRSVRVVNGQFEINILSGVEYEIAVDDSGIFVSPPTQRQTFVADTITDLQLQLSEPDATISGKAHLTDSGMPPVYAEISAYSTNGQHVMIQADVDGAFSLPAKSGSTWNLTASWVGQPIGTTTYAVYGVAVEVDTAGDTEVALWLEPEAFQLPTVSQTFFEQSAAHRTMLADGTTITVPAGAVPVGDMDGDDVRMEIKPLVTGLPHSYSIDSVEYGYTIQLFNQHTGEEITNNLSQEIVVTYQYTDEALAAMNADESTLVPAVRPAGTNVWGSTANFTMDPQKNEVTMSISQASDAALTVRRTREQPSQTEFSFIPLMFR